MPERTALAFDPSPTGFAFGFVRQPAPGRIFERIETGEVDAGDMTATRKAVQELYARLKPTVCAVESVAGFVSTKRMDRMEKKSSMNIQLLVDTAMYAGVITASLPDPAACLLMPANNFGKSLKAWRYHLTRRPTSGDKEVAAALDFYLSGSLPVRGHRTVSVPGYHGATMKAPIYIDNDHKRDALGLAVVALLLTQ